jgi:hypothetical protein
MFSIFVRRHADACLKGMLMHAAKRAITLREDQTHGTRAYLPRLVRPVAGIVKRLSDLLPVVRSGLHIRASSSAIRSKAWRRLSPPMSLMTIWMKSRTAPRPQWRSGRWQVGELTKRPPRACVVRCSPIAIAIHGLWCGWIRSQGACGGLKLNSRAGRYLWSTHRVDHWSAAPAKISDLKLACS